ncbi:hypothetical protein OAO01_00745 [Oligoflexia bacterium]|nr:hypothetical protein [Oligoflexia bacterium]
MKYDVNSILEELRARPVQTWFDLGEILDELRCKREDLFTPFPGSFDDFKQSLQNSGLGFLHFFYGIDGVTVEIEKYATALTSILPEMPIHFIAGRIEPESDRFLHPAFKRHIIPEMDGFLKWQFYKPFFFNKLVRGTNTYNELPGLFWEEVLLITERLGRLVEDNSLGLLFVANYCSNPGNVSGAFAIALVAEYLGLPVIANNHDYYWEGGNKKNDIQTKGLKPGTRDFFFKNAKIGEFFTLIEVLFPWQSKTWLTCHINKPQTDHVITVKGHNPANLAEVRTYVDTTQFSKFNKFERLSTFHQVQSILSLYSDSITTFTPSELLEGNGNIVKEEAPDPIVVASKNHVAYDFIHDNIVFLQPTRLTSRKRIDVGFRLVKKLFETRSFLEKFESNPQLALTILVTGVFPAKKFFDFENLIKSFDEYLKEIPDHLRNRIFLACMFSEFDRPRFKERYQSPVTIPDLYNIASLILLPSETEGRGLPILEAAASGVLIFCRRYHPVEVYAAVIGEHLPEDRRLKVMEFLGGQITGSVARAITERIFFPQNFIDEVKHNRRAIERRYSFKAMKKGFERMLRQLYLQCTPRTETHALTRMAINKFNMLSIADGDDISTLICQKDRLFLPGIGRCGNLLNLRSLVDPSHFRVEEQELKGYCFKHARYLLRKHPAPHEITRQQRHDFYNAVEGLFEISLKNDVKFDHSLSYRYKSDASMLCAHYTHQELLGIINIIYNEVLKPPKRDPYIPSARFFTDWKLALFQLTGSARLEIDNRDELITRLKENRPLAYFPGECMADELELFVLAPLRERLGQQANETITAELIRERKDDIEPVYIFCRKNPLGEHITYGRLKAFIDLDGDVELKLLLEHGLCKLVMTEQFSVGVNVQALGENALAVLADIKKRQGLVVTVGENAAFMTDILEMDRFHIGRITHALHASALGLQENSGFIQYVPAGFRAVLGFPVPSQTALEFDKTLRQDTYRKLLEEKGRGSLSSELRRKLSNGDLALQDLLSIAYQPEECRSKICKKALRGLHADGSPWTGFEILLPNLKSTPGNNVRVIAPQAGLYAYQTFLDELPSDGSTVLAWSCGSFLTHYQSARLGLSRELFESPLGLRIVNGKLIAPPLGKKGALLVDESGSISLERVSCESGISLSYKNQEIRFPNQAYNAVDPETGLGFFDFLSAETTLDRTEKFILQFRDCTLVGLKKPKSDSYYQMQPTGLVVAIPQDLFPDAWIEIGGQFSMAVPGYEASRFAIECGPLLLKDGEQVLDFESEGWLSERSIRANASGIHEAELSRPHLIFGYKSDGAGCLLCIFGRTRYSVGATYKELLDCLRNEDVVTAIECQTQAANIISINRNCYYSAPYSDDIDTNVRSAPATPFNVPAIVALTLRA